MMTKMIPEDLAKRLVLWEDLMKGPVRSHKVWPEQ